MNIRVVYVGSPVLAGQVFWFTSVASARAHAAETFRMVPGATPLMTFEPRPRLIMVD